MNIMKRFFSAMLAVAALIGPAVPARAAAALDGTTWTAPLDKDGAKTDTLSFDKGRFNSSECVQYGYKGDAYQSKTKAGAVTWTSVQKNEQGDTMNWKGSWDGKSDEMRGQFVFTDKNGKKQDAQEWTAKRQN